MITMTLTPIHQHLAMLITIPIWWRSHCLQHPLDPSFLLPTSPPTTFARADLHLRSPLRATPTTLVLFPPACHLDANRSYQPSPMDSTRSTIFSSYQPPFYDSHDSFAHGAPDPLLDPPPPFNRAKPSPSFDPPLKSSPSYNSFPHASPAPRKTSPGVVHGTRTEKPRSKPELARAEKRKSQRGQRVGHGAAAEGVSHAQRQLERKGATAVAAIYAALGDEVQCLVMDQYGNYLFQKLVDMSSDDQRREVVGDEGRRER